jgi:predicted nucleic acid-binding protein
VALTLVDTGVIVAALDRSERYHQVCAEVLTTTSRLLTCEAVLAESCYLLRRIPGAAERLLQNVSEGILQIPFQLSLSAPAIVRILRKYRDREVDLADACLIHLATELKTGEILTLDRDFLVYRWGSNRPFRILIDISRKTM